MFTTFQILVEVYLELTFILELINVRFQEKVNQGFSVLIRDGFYCSCCFVFWHLKEFEVYFILVIYVQKPCQNFIANFMVITT